MATEPRFEFKPFFVIVGSTIAEATGKYHELVAEGDERIKGSPIRLAVVHTARRHLEGVRVHGYAFTDSAMQHEHAWDVIEVLQRSVLKLGLNRNNPQTGDK